jgi:hypothetical protein
MRHFKDDVYMAVRLAQWVRDKVEGELVEGRMDMGELTMHMGSFHIFDGDRPMVKHLAINHVREQNRRLLEALQ